MSERLADSLRELDAARSEGLADGTWPTDAARDRRWWPPPEGEAGMDWPGCARMAAARLAAGLELDERDREALRRQPAESP